MNIALLGYGRMGRTIEKTAEDRGHKIGLKVDKNGSFSLKNIDVAIDFSVPEAAVGNISQSLENKVPVVCGTTGWLQHYDQMAQLCKKNNGAFLYASNFSVGVNIFFELNRQLAKMMQNVHGYEVSMEEIHHIHKLDAPSGTAITLAEEIIANSYKTGWALDKKEEGKIAINAVREGEIPGTHSIRYESRIDEINIEHKAHSREGFAQGAVLAAEWLYGKTGVFGMKDVLGI